MSYFAEVADGHIVGYVCKNSVGEIIPSFVITQMTVRPTDANNNPTHLTIPGVASPLDMASDGGLQFCCHNIGGHLHCHPIECPA